MAEVYIFNQNDELETIISRETGGLAAPFREEVNRGSTFSLLVDATHDNAKHVVEENQIVFKDKEGHFRLYVIKEIDDIDSDQGTFTEAICEPAFMELREKIVVERIFTDKEAQEALDGALAGTRWVGEVEVSLGISSTSFYYLTATDAIWKVLAAWGGEFQDVVEFNGNNITRRVIKIVQRKGKDRGKRFEIDYDIEEIERTVLSYPVTALYGRGASLEITDEEGNPTGGYSRLIDFGDVEWKVSNGDPVDKPLGQKWVGDPNALQKYGYLHKGQLLHREAKWENGNIEDPEILLAETWNHLQIVKDPEVNYRLKVLLLEQLAGYEHEKVELGDTCFAIDRKFSRPIELQTRVIVMEYDVFNIEETATVEMGQFLSVYDEDNRLDKVIDYINENRGNIERPPGSTIVDDESFPDIKPPVPSNVSAIGLFKTINIRWTYEAASYIAAYEIYASQSKGFIPQPQHMIWRGKVGGFNYAVGNDEQWYFRVRTINTHGTRSDFSPEVSAYTQRLKEVDFDELTVLDAFIQNVLADKITSGTLDANNVNIVNLLADAIVGGTLDLSKELIIKNGNNIILAVNALTQEVEMNVNKLTIGKARAATIEDIEEIELTPGPEGPEGPKGDDGKGIVSATVTYQNHTSGSTPPTTWLTTIPAPVKGRYLWTRTVTTYTEGNPITTYSVAYTATDGQNGADGKGISNTTVTYQLHTNGTTAPTGTWLASPPAPVKGQYLWTRTVITYTSGTPSTSYSTSYYATDGQKGDPGPPGQQGIQGPPGTNGTSQYVHIRYSANSNGNPMTTTWQTTSEYIGLANTTSATAPTSYTAYSWALIKGADGARGQQGIPGAPGADGTTTYTWVRYADNENGGGISNNPDGKRYIGLAFNKTSPTESNTASDYKWTALYDNVQVGGRNLIPDSHFESGDTNGWSSIYGTHVVEEGVYKKTFTSLSSAARLERVFNDLEVGVYTLTVYAKTPQNLDWRSFVGATQVSSHGQTADPNNFKTYSVTFTVATAGDVTVRAYVSNIPVGGVIEIDWFQLEKGNVATDWTPALEDIEDELNSKAGLEDIDNLAKIVSDISAEVNAKAGMGEFEAMQEAYNTRVSQDIEDKAALAQTLSDMDGRTEFVRILAEDSKIVTDFINTTIVESEEGVFIGNQANNTGVLVSSARISFVDNGTEVAYISNKTMEITHGIFVETATIADFKFEKIPGTEILTITWVGD